MAGLLAVASESYTSTYRMSRPPLHARSQGVPGTLLTRLRRSVLLLPFRIRIPPTVVVVPASNVRTALPVVLLMSQKVVLP